MEDKLKQGEALFAEGKIEEAEKCFLSILEENPENEEVLNNLGVTLEDDVFCGPNQKIRLYPEDDSCMICGKKTYVLRASLVSCN